MLRRFVAGGRWRQSLQILTGSKAAVIPEKDTKK
jgi:hypothetical protein